jgi:hypothetical protein
MILRFRLWEKHIIKRLIEPRNQALGRFPQLQVDSHHLVVEEVLEGRQVNVDGFVHEGRFQLLGIAERQPVLCGGPSTAAAVRACRREKTSIGWRRSTRMRGSSCIPRAAIRCGGN